MFKENKEIFNILSEAVTEGVVVVDKHQNIVLVNSAAADMFGYDKEALQEKPLSILIPQTYHGNHHKYVSGYLKNSSKRQMGSGRDLYAIHKSGREFPVEIGLSPIEKGESSYTMALVIDITERKKLEFLKKKQNHILELIVQGHPLLHVLNDIVQLIERQADDVYVSILSYNSAEKTLHTLVAPNLPKAYNQQIDGVKIGENKGSCGTAAYLKKDVIVTDISNDPLWGNYKDLAAQHHLQACWASPIISSKNNVLGTFAIYRKEHKQFNAINTSSINIGNKLAGIAIEKHLTDENLQQAQVQLENYAQDLQELVDERTVALKKSIVELRDSNLTLENEVNKRKEAQAKIKHALKREKELNELKTKFLSLVSHEFKTPLSGILTSTMLLGKYTLETQQEKRDKHIGTIASKVHYLNNILNDFLSVEKLELGKVNYTFSTFKLSKVVNEVVYNANMLLKDGQKIKYPEHIDDISLTQDEKFVELALSNLVHNAIKYSSENTTIEIIINTDGVVTKFKIIDQGMGIPKLDQKNIFNRYFRAENALLTQGTGIGLNIVKSHLENLNGTITFESEEGKGSTFTMNIPNSAI